MKICLSLLLSLLFLAQFSFASITVKGRVFDQNTGAPMEYATVRACHLPDSAFVQGGITDPSGNFSLQLEKGRYVLEFQYMGFIPTFKNVNLDGSKSTVDVGKIQLKPDQQMLNEVDVVAEKSTYEMTLDKRVFNVGKDVSNTAGNAIEVLENIPAVSVDVEGNVSLRGDEGVRILIDGKESGLSGMSTQDALRTLQGDMIEKVEVITNPSVRYDAEGSAGIINIILKKDKRQGFNGALNVRGGYPWQYGGSFTGNYRLRKWNFFSSVGYNHRSNIGGGVNKTKHFTDIIGTDTIFDQITDQTTERTMGRDGVNFRLGADYYITDRDILSVAGMVRYGKNTSHPTVKYFDEYPLLDSSSYDVRSEDWQETSPMYEVNMSYDKTFDREGQSLKAEVRYFQNYEDSESNITEKLYLSPDDMLHSIFDLYQRTKENQSMRNVQATVDYVHPFAQKAQWEIGGKYTFRDINDWSGVTQKGDDGQYHPLEDYCYDYEYNEQVSAIYTSIGNDWGRWSAQVGLRAEMTNIYTNMKGYAHDDNDSINRTDTINLFPSAHINYSFNENNQLQISYTRRIRRPGFWDMSPFRSYNDNRNIRMGNPALKPTYMDSYELGYIHFWERSSLSFTAYYRHGTNMRRHYTYEEDGVYYSKPVNFGKADDFGAEAVVQGQILSWWNLNGNVNFFKSFTRGTIEGQYYETKSWMCFARVLSKFTIVKGLDLQLTAHIMGPHLEPLGKRDGEWWLDAAISKEVFQGNGTITFNVRDVFGTRGHGGESWGDNFWQYSNSTWNRTSMSLNFNYRINQQMNKRGKRPMDDGGGDDDGGGSEEMY